jgi:integrase
MPSAVKIYDRIVARTGADPDRHLFLPQYSNRATAQHKMWKAFGALLKRTGLASDGFGNKRVPYSLRHSALMFRLLNGENVDLLALARNAGTSIGMLERFYLSHLGPAMKLANLQSFKARPSA